MKFDIIVIDLFNLANQNQYFGGSPTLQNKSDIIVIVFPVEGRKESAAVALQQSGDGHIAGRVYGSTPHPQKGLESSLGMSLIRYLTAEAGLILVNEVR